MLVDQVVQAAQVVRAELAAQVVRAAPVLPVELALPLDFVEQQAELVEQAELVGENELDRVLDGDHVRRPGLVDVLQHRGDGRGLAGPRNARYEDQTPLQRGQVLDLPDRQA